MPPFFDGRKWVLSPQGYGNPPQRLRGLPTIRKGRANTAIPRQRLAPLPPPFRKGAFGKLQPKGSFLKGAVDAGD